MKSLQTRIFLSFWAAMALLVVGSVGFTWIVVAERLGAVPRFSGVLIRRAADTLASGGEAALVDWLRNDREGGDDVRVLVVGPDGHELLGRALPVTIDHLLHRPDGGAGAAPLPPGYRMQPAQPLPQLVGPDGRTYGILVQPRRHFAGPFGLLLEARYAVLILALVVTFVASRVLARSITRPVRALGAATRRIAAGQLEQRVDPSVTRRPDELGTLARDFDLMAERLRALLAARQQLLRDVSHELRSPLARMRVALGLVRHDGGASSPELERIELEIERLDHLIGQVLQLARLDARSDEPEDDVDLVELVEAIVRDAAFEGGPREIAVVASSLPARAIVRGHPTWLASAIENVVRNAVRYAEPGTAVEIGLDFRPTSIEVRVADRGPGVPAAELARIFEPFHRVAESRDRDSGGDGIGLAIVARVLELHGGRATAALRPGGGLVVSLQWPREPSVAT